MTPEEEVVWLRPEHARLTTALTAALGERLAKLAGSQAPGIAVGQGRLGQRLVALPAHLRTPGVSADITPAERRLRPS